MRSILCGKNGGAARPHKADDGSSEGELELSAGDVGSVESYDEFGEYDGEFGVHDGDA